MLILLFFLFLYIRISFSLDSLAVNQSIRDGQTLVSANGTFELGFFNPPGNSRGRYLGMWYRNLLPLTVVWVANREIPVKNNSGILKLDENGVLVVLNGANGTIWSSNMTNKVLNDSITAQLLETGNLVLTIRKDNVLWQSFDYPCDTILPGMMLGWNLVTDLNRFLTS
jgi:hypothetical protein